MTYDAIVLAGGASRRLGGVNKPAIVIGGRRMLDIAIEAVAGAASTIVVGPPQPTVRDVRWTRERPPGGGPVAAIAAGLALVDAPAVVVVAADLPFVTPETVEQLVRAQPGAGDVVAVDDDGRDQPLLGCYDTGRLSEALPSDPHGESMRSLLRELETAGEVRRLRIPADPPATLDCDTAADISRAQGGAGMTLEEWIDEVSRELGIEPIDASAVLDLARDVAHGVARPAAPLTCLLVGLAASTADDLDAVITRVRSLLPDPDLPPPK